MLVLHIFENGPGTSQPIFPPKLCLHVAIEALRLHLAEQLLEPQHSICLLEPLLLSSRQLFPRLPELAQCLLVHILERLYPLCLCRHSLS